MSTPGDGGGAQKRDFGTSEDGTSPGIDGSVGGDGGAIGSGEKKRRTGAGSARGVANLTPEQLAKKRANDREAQRAIRERTKNTIEQLERKIRELTSQQPYQELQQVLRLKDAIEAENVDIKKRLSSVIALIQPVLGQHGLDLPSYTGPSQSYMPSRAASTSNINTPSSGSAQSPVGSQWHVPPTATMVHDPRAFSQMSASQIQQLSKQRHDITHGLDMGPERLGLEFLLDSTQRINKIPNGINGITEPSSFQSLPSSRSSDKGSPAHHRSNSISSQMNYNTNTSDMSGHAVPIRNGPPTCPLDSLLLDFLHERQQLAADGISTPKLVGPAYPSVSSLLNPARGINSHPLSKVFTDILQTFPDLSTLPEKVAVLYIMFLIMRWQIAPTQENYDRLPDWVCPRASQLFTPHPAWIDHLPWPKMRDRLVRDYNPRDYLFDNFFIPFTTTLSLNWPYEPTDTLLGGGAGRDGEEGELVINPVFERHLRRLENWSLGQTFADVFPGLQDTYRLKTEGDRR